MTRRKPQTERLFRLIGRLDDCPMALTLDFLATVVAAAISPRREPWDTIEQKQSAPDGNAVKDFLPSFQSAAAER